MAFKNGFIFGTRFKGPALALLGSRSYLEAETWVLSRTEVKSGYGHSKVRGDSKYT